MKNKEKSSSSSYMTEFLALWDFSLFSHFKSHHVIQLRKNIFSYAPDIPEHDDDIKFLESNPDFEILRICENNYQSPVSLHWPIIIPTIYSYSVARVNRRLTAFSVCMGVCLSISKELRLDKRCHSDAVNGEKCNSSAMTFVKNE